MIRFLFLALLAIPSIALAQEKQSQMDVKVYSPEYCQFSAIFPEEPFLSERCEDPKKNENCYDLVSYTKVFDMASTIRVEIICNPATAEMYQYFNPKVMETTVRAMTKGTVIEAYEVNSRQEENYRQTSLLGKGKKGLDDSIYIAQLWAGETSIMSVEAEMSGAQNADADKVFAEILSNIGFFKVNDVEKDAAPESKADETAP